MMLAIIIGCEIAFWVVLAAGIGARYLLKRPRLGLVLLACVPMIDLVLLLVTVLHLRAGATAEWAHGLAALYLGFSVVYGHMMIKWADRWAAYWWADGPKPLKLYGDEHRSWAVKDLGRSILAGAIAAGLLWLGIWYVGDETRTAAMSQWYATIAIVVVINAIVDLHDIVWPRKPATRRPASQPRA